MFNNLQAQKDLKLVPFSYDNLFVFENTEMMNYFQAYSKANLVVGGLDTVGSLSSIGDFHLNDSTYIFIENQGMSESYLASFLNSKDLETNVLFYNGKTIDDLVLDTLDSAELIAPSDLFLNTSQGGWLKDTVTSYSWTPLTLGNYNNLNASGKYDFGLGHNLLYTYYDQPLKFDINVDKQGEYDVWARFLFSPAGGNLTFSIDGYRFVIDTAVNDTPNSILSGFKWVRFGNITLNSGKHFVIIKNENGALNAVNLVALPIVSMLENHRQNVFDLLTQSDARIVYLMDKAFLGSLSVGGSLSVPFNAPKQSLYYINFQSNEQLSELNLTVDNLVCKATKSNIFSGSENWYSAGPINLLHGTHNITLSNGLSKVIEKIIIFSSCSTNNSMDSLQKILGGGAEPFVISYHKTDSVSFSVVVNTSKTFVLSFHEAYDEFWESNISATRLILNSVDNSFLVNVSSQVPKNELVTINVTYSPESAFQLGIKVTVVSFIFLIAIILLVQVFPKFKKKLAS